MARKPHLSTEAIEVLSCLRAFPNGVPIHEIAEEAFGKGDMRARGLVKRAFREIRQHCGLLIDSHNLRAPGEVDLFSLPAERYAEVQAFLTIHWKLKEQP